MALGAEQEARQATKARIASLQGELDTFEAYLATPESDKVLPRLDATLFYFGGRPAQVGICTRSPSRPVRFSSP